ncbi:MBL fold metallo-hydrolase [Loktanella sp. Alg231-35]|uniref:MBL fold metallo-hydrolase n=1 Tax=Loktanella sp. Alg231-35 TaxID=1922220 RepID=UPI000D561F42|nr:MBL fold metallo-hydrolase [Loktanella sp. Alg231-35]
MHTRRRFLSSAAAAGGITLLPYRVNAASHGAHDSFASATGEVIVTPKSHASFVMETPAGTIYVDPVGEASLYADMPTPDLILITHEHGDHYNPATLGAIAGADTVMISNPAVYSMLPAQMQAKTTSVGNGDSTSAIGVSVDAIPAYNTTQERLNFHPQGRDNGYVVTVDGLRIYISGDTEDIPEMRSLQNIDIAFVCMNLPFTMDAEAAASAVNEFAPTYVYPYHYRGRDDGTQDPAKFAGMLEGDSEAKMGAWYG